MVMVPHNCALLHNLQDIAQMLIVYGRIIYIYMHADNNV